MQREEARRIPRGVAVRLRDRGASNRRWNSGGNFPPRILLERTCQNLYGVPKVCPQGTFRVRTCLVNKYAFVIPSAGSNPCSSRNARKEGFRTSQTPFTMRT